MGSHNMTPIPDKTMDCIGAISYGACLVLLYINNITEDLSSTIELVADDTMIYLLKSALRNSDLFNFEYSLCLM